MSSEAFRLLGDPENTSGVDLALVQPLTLAHERALPVAESLLPLAPSGLRRGSTVGVGGSGAISLGLALAAESVRQGSWVAIVGSRGMGLAALVDYDIPLERVVLVDRVDPSSWAAVTAALIDGFDVVMAASRDRVRPRDARNLVARARERGSVLMRVGRASPTRGDGWPESADLHFEVSDPCWVGLGQGHGHLQNRRVTVDVTGRRGAGAGRRRFSLMLPDESGRCRLAEAEPADRFAGADADALVEAEARAGREFDSSAEGRGGREFDSSADDTAPPLRIA